MGIGTGLYDVDNGVLERISDNLGPKLTWPAGTASGCIVSTWPVGDKRVTFGDAAITGFTDSSHSDLDSKHNRTSF